MSHGNQRPLPAYERDAQTEHQQRMAKLDATEVRLDALAQKLIDMGPNWKDGMPPNWSVSRSTG